MLKQEEAASASMIERLSAKLKGRRMFESEEAMRRLLMCEDRRVSDLLERENAHSANPG
ncbi:MAG: hypothetical protein OD817_04155 [Gammaproteobacteria bacterium]